MRTLFSIIVFLLAAIAPAQEIQYAVALIPEALSKDANAVVRSNSVLVTINSRRSVSIATKRVVTILNEFGLREMDAYEFRNIQSVRATAYDAAGNVIRKFKSSDFKQYSASEGFEISDNRVTTLDYTPVQYPFTLVYESVVSDSNTAFLPAWSPVEGVFVSTQVSEIAYRFPADLGFRFKEYNFSDSNISKTQTSTSVRYNATNFPAVRSEHYAPSQDKIFPYVMFGLEKFHLEGVDGEASDWKSFGRWYNQLFDGVHDLPEETVAKIRALTANENDPIKKARIVYKYVQDKTRYVSIQLGIGGWKPMKAKDVDRLGYGDCKALTNYTRCLLEAVGVESYYTIIHAADEKRDIREDFVSVQGNHIVLAVPDGKSITWLECTNQTAPFGYQGSRTCGRTALMLKPDGGELIRTREYPSAENTQFSTGRYAIDVEGKISASLKIKSTGLQYENRAHLERLPSDKQDRFYKDYFSVNDLALKSAKFSNDMEKIEYSEDISFAAPRYASVSNNRLIFPVNAFNQSNTVPQRYRSRNAPLEIGQGFYDVDEITIDIPEGFTIEAKPENVTLTDKFGEYNAEFTIVSPNQLLYKRTLKVNEGIYAAAEYENYRKFREQVAKMDNAKMVIAKI